MGDIFDAMYLHLERWDAQYAERWIAFMRATRNGWESDHERACRFWTLELSAVDTEVTRRIREHLVPTNDLWVIMDIFKVDVLPFLAKYEKSFKHLSRKWGGSY